MSKLRKWLSAFRGERGSSLLEVIIAMLIMLFLMISILQLFSMGFLLNVGSAARTEMDHKCEQVVETIRFVRWVRENGGAVLPDPGIPDPLSPVSVNLPFAGVAGSYWGPSHSNIVEFDNPPYRLSYVIRDGDATGEAPGQWVVNVLAEPAPTAAPGVRKYMGLGIENKRIVYVAFLPK